MKREDTGSLVRVIFCLAALALIILLSLPARAAEVSNLGLKVEIDQTILWSFAGLGGLLAIKVLFAISAALRVPAGQPGAFDVRLLPDFLKSNVVPYLIPLAGMAVASAFVPSMKAMYLAAAATYAAKLVADIRDNIVQLFGPGAAPPGN